jgi:hypothetical protein
LAFFVTELVASPTLDSLDQQREAILGWLGTGECESWCSVCARRAGLPADSAGEVRSEAWIRISGHLGRRTEYFPEMLDVGSARRYAARVCERTAIDLARSSRSRGFAVSVDGGEVEYPPVLDAMSGLVNDVMLGQWRTALVAEAQTGSGCSGCPEDVVTATSLRILGAYGSGERAPLRDLMYEALAEVDDRSRDDRSAASRQRKSRCGRCVAALLRATAERMGYDT